MALESAAEISPAQSAERTGADRMAAEVDIVQKMHLKDPAKLTMPEMYGMPSDIKSEDVRSMLQGFGIDDPKAFMHAVHRLSDRTHASRGDTDLKHPPITKSFLERAENDVNLSEQERGAARFMRANFRGFAQSDPQSTSMKFYGGLVPESKLEITDQGIANMDKSADIVENSRRHPEMRDRAALAETAKSLFGQVNPDNQFNLPLKDLQTIEHSPKFTEQQRAAASMLAANHQTFDELSKQYDNITRKDIDVLARSPQKENVEESQSDPDCQKVSAGKNAAAWGVGVAVLSAALGSKNALRNGAVAAASAAAAAGIRNSEVCKK